MTLLTVSWHWRHGCYQRRQIATGAAQDGLESNSVDSWREQAIPRRISARDLAGGLQLRAAGNCGIAGPSPRPKPALSLVEGCSQ